MVFKLNEYLRYPKEHIANIETNIVGVDAHIDPLKKYTKHILNDVGVDLVSTRKIKEKKSPETEGVKMINNLKTKNKINIKLLLSMALLLLCLFVIPNKINAAIIDDTKALTTVWQIPSGDITITLPLSGTNMEMLVDWGDGTVETVTENYKTHPYNFAEDTPVTIKVQYVAGTEIDWGYNASSAVTEDSNFYTYTKYLTKLTNWGDMPAKEYGFAQCVNLTEVSGEAKDNSFKYMKNMSCMFYNCTRLETIRMNNVDTSNVTNMDSLFLGCSQVTTLDVDNWNTINVTNMGQVFNGCSKLTELNINNWKTDNVTSFRYMFSSCSNLAKLNLSSWNTSNVQNMCNTFSLCSNLEELNISEWLTINVTDMSALFSRCSSLISLNLASWNTSNVTSMESLFYDCNSLTSLDVSGLDTGNVTKMASMFYNCNKLTEIDVSEFDTSKVTNMSGMFESCNSLTEIDVSNWNTEDVTTMYSLFSGCSKVPVLDVSNFDTSKVTTMANMFNGCSGLTSLDVRNFNTENVTAMNAMFGGCSGLTTIDVSNFNTEKVTAMGYMFSHCNGLTIVDLRNFNTSKVTNMSYMFWNASKIKNILISNQLIVANTNSGMFAGTNASLSFITISKDPVSSQFKGILTGSRYVYVPNESYDSYVTTLSGDTLASNIKPIVEPIGDSPLYMLKGNAYIEKGATVAGYTADKASSYMVYGYSLETSGDVNTRDEGSYPVEYILTRNASGETQTTKATRMVYIYSATKLTLYKDGEVYDGEWTNKDIIGKATILSPDTTSLVVKAGNSGWETNPSYAEVTYSGDEVYVVFNGTIDADVYVREVDVNGKATTYSSNGCAIKIDKDLPTIENITHTTEEKELILRANASDNESGIAYYAIGDGTKYPNNWKATTGEIEETLLSSGRYYLYVRDQAGNETVSDELILIKDIKAPKGTIEIVGIEDETGDKFTNQSKVTINILVEDNKTAKDDILFAVYSKENYAKVKSGEMETTWMPYEESVEFTLDEEDGEQIIYVIFKDGAGNVSMTEKSIEL